MCRRFTLGIEPEKLQEKFQIPEMPVEWHQRFNIASTQPIAVINNADQRHIEFFRWGLIPS